MLLKEADTVYSGQLFPVWTTVAKARFGKELSSCSTCRCVTFHRRRAKRTGGEEAKPTLLQSMALGHATSIPRDPWGTDNSNHG